MQVITAEDMEVSSKNTVSYDRMTRAQAESAIKAIFDAGKVVAIGKLLARKQKSTGKTFAELLVSEKELQFPQVKITNGVVAIAESHQTIRIQAGASWFCPCCASAHGSRVGKSAKGNDPVNVKSLESNEWFYQPNTGKLFTVSGTCRNTYLKPYYGQVIQSDHFKPEVKKAK